MTHVQSRIFVVEDEFIISKDIQNRLKQFGYAIAGAAASGEDAVARVEAVQPDLVLMDITLKGRMTGIEAAELVSKLFNIPVVFFTAYTDRDTQDKAKTTDAAYGYVYKPFEERKLKVAIEMALAKHRSEQEKLRRKEQVWQLQTLVAMGHLVNSRTPELNRTLNVIGGNLRLAMMQAGEATMPYLQRAQKATQNATRLVENLSAFCGQRKMDLRVFDVTESVRQAGDTCGRLLCGKMGLTFDISNEPHPIRGDQQQIRQVILNLCLNARDALHRVTDNRAKRIVVSLDNVHDVGRAADFVRVRVQDNGVGMDDAVKQYMFVPFFTTRSMDSGAGMGLAVAYGIVTHHQGWIDCRSRPGEGTMFSVYLPVHIDINRGKRLKKHQGMGNDQRSTGRAHFLTSDGAAGA